MVRTDFLAMMMEYLFIQYAIIKSCDRPTAKTLIRLTFRGLAPVNRQKWKNSYNKH